MAFDISRLVEFAAKRRVAGPSEGWLPPVAPAAVYLLADNLDAALAAGEDLLKERFVWNAGTARSADEIAYARAEVRASIETVRSLEMVLVARVLKTREQAEELARHDARFKPVVKLYAAGTAPLMEASAEFGDPTVHDFETGDATTAYLRTRGFIAQDDPAPADGATVAVREDFLVARRTRLGALMDLVAMFLDTLETHYELYGLEDDEAYDDNLAPLMDGIDSSSNISAKPSKANEPAVDAAGSQNLVSERSESAVSAAEDQPILPSAPAGSD